MQHHAHHPPADFYFDFVVVGNLVQEGFTVVHECFEVHFIYQGGVALSIVLEDDGLGGKLTPGIP